jgi:Asp-tRNA(Asn)/Glu-tRNA(Gln) amidotransferase A subunit family amidase
VNAMPVGLQLMSKQSSDKELLEISNICEGLMS